MNFFVKVGALITVASLGTACGIRSNDAVTIYEDVPFGLADPSTTTTTTTTTIAEPQNSVPTPSTTTTTMAENLRRVEFAYIVGFTRELDLATVEMQEPVTERALINQLATDPSDIEPGLRTEVTRGLILGFTVDRGVATVALSQSSVNALNSVEQRRAIAQIVLTLTLFASDQGGIGQVLFEVNGEPLSVYVPLLGENSDPAQPVAWTDFAQLLVGVPTPSTTTTSPPTTTSATPATPSTTTVDPSPTSTEAPSASTTVATPPTTIQAAPSSTSMP